MMRCDSVFGMRANIVAVERHEVRTQGIPSREGNPCMADLQAAHDAAFRIRHEVPSRIHEGLW